jgi:hypothetical protein
VTYYVKLSRPDMILPTSFSVEAQSLTAMGRSTYKFAAYPAHTGPGIMDFKSAVSVRVKKIAGQAM